ncbi:hypothetical protein [Kitasatospora camelliae]|uniref:Secreted protein n=1 Tax=Kitasatospora camelliae TaxID=3156397 RepID=A0AAU8K878_9ACTN
MMLDSPRSFSRGWALAAGIPALLGGTLFLLGSTPADEQVAVRAATGRAGTAAAPPAAVPPADPAMPTSPWVLAAARGLAEELGGYRLNSPVTDLPAGLASGYPFTVTGPDGRPVTEFTTVQTKPMHFYAIREDLGGYQHLHPVMAADGTWTADLAALDPGNWRLYASFVPGAGGSHRGELILSRTVKVPGQPAPAAAPAAPAGPAGDVGRATVDGYTVSVRQVPATGGGSQLTATVSKDGQPVTDLQPYLDSYAHLSAFHAGDQGLAHLHPLDAVAGDHGGPTLTFHSALAMSGDWRLYLQFQTGGQVHTADLTLRFP